MQVLKERCHGFTVDSAVRSTESQPREMHETTSKESTQFWSSTAPTLKDAKRRIQEIKREHRESCKRLSEKWTRKDYGDMMNRKN